MNTPVATLRPGRDKRARAGHPWIFSNELQGVADLPEGGTVDVVSHEGAFVGRGYANPRSLIAIRLLTRNRREDIDHPAFYLGRLREAAAYREAVQPGRRDLRLVHAEGDGLPGLIVDRYDDVLAVQINTLGMEVRKGALQEALLQVFGPRGAVLRNTSRARELEGLPVECRAWFGEVPEEVVVEEHGVRFRVTPLAGQKTGHFYDQAENRRLAAALCRGRRVLDVYAYNGAWALHALAAGAEAAVTVDKSEDACRQAEQNAALNGVSDRLTILHSEGKKALEHLVAAGERFGAVVLDPPAFAKTRKAATSALRGYRDINVLGMNLVAPGGLLFTSSCSYHIEEDRFVGVLQQAARRANCRVRILRRGEQAPDHPVVPGVPESRYLKSYALHLVPAT